MESIAELVTTFQISKITECALQIAKNEFFGDTLIIYNNTAGADKAGIFAKAALRPVLMYSTDIVFEYDENAAIVATKNIIWMPSLEDFEQQIKNVRNNVWWKSSAKVLIIFHEKIHVGETFSQLWQHARASNVVLINENLDLFSWIPYETQNCNEDIIPVKLSKCTKIHHPIFFNRIPNQMNHCQFNVTTKQVWPFVGPVSESTQATDGLEVAIINTIAQKLQIDLKYVLIPDDVSFYPSPEETVLTGAAEKLYNYETDMVFGSMFQTSQHSSYAEVLKLPHTSDQLIWFIPQPQEIPAYKNLYLAFELDSWIAIFIATCLIISTKWLLEKVMENHQPETGLQILFALSVNLNTSVPMPKSKLLKTFMIICFIYGLHVITAYQSSLISFLTRPVMDEPVKTVKEGIAKGLMVYLYVPHKPYIIQPEFPDQEDILQPGRHVFREQMHFELMQTFQDKMVLGVKSTTLFYLTWLNIVDKNGQLLVMTMDKDVLFFFVTMLMARGHPLKPKFDKALQQIMESGLREKWMQDLMRKSRKVTTNFLSDKISLTVSNLSGAFYILTIGLCISFMVFAIEVLHRRVSRSRGKNIRRKVPRVIFLH